MNREERRNLMKQGAKKETVDKLSQFDKPASIKEVINISRAVAQDVSAEYVEDYRKRSAGVIMATSIQLELLKKLVTDKGLITEEEFNKLYEVAAAEFEEAQRKYVEEQMRLAEQQKNQQESPVVSAKSEMNPVGPVKLEVVK